MPNPTEPTRPTAEQRWHQAEEQELERAGLTIGAGLALVEDGWQPRPCGPRTHRCPVCGRVILAEYAECYRHLPPAPSK